jgi:hypothetical protein
MTVSGMIEGKLNSGLGIEVPPPIPIGTSVRIRLRERDDQRRCTALLQN